MRPRCSGWKTLVHPLVAARARRISAAQPIAPIVLFDIPLLLETGADEEMDAVVVASAPADVQRAAGAGAPRHDGGEIRGACRPARWSDAEKRAQAHYVVMTDKGLDHAREQVKMILADIRNKIRKLHA